MMLCTFESLPGQDQQYLCRQQDKIRCTGPCICQAVGMMPLQALTLRVILWDCHKKEVAYGRKQN